MGRRASRVTADFIEFPHLPVGAPLANKPELSLSGA